MAYFKKPKRTFLARSGSQEILCLCPERLPLPHASSSPAVHTHTNAALKSLIPIHFPPLPEELSIKPPACLQLISLPPAPYCSLPQPQKRIFICFSTCCERKHLPYSPALTRTMIAHISNSDGCYSVKATRTELN